MRAAGWIMVVLGVIGLLAGFTMNTSVSSGIGGRVVNIGLIGQQTAMLTVSGFLFMTGSILLGLCSIRESIEAISLRQDLRANDQQPEAGAGEAPTPNDLRRGVKVTHLRHGDGEVIRATEPGMWEVRFPDGIRVTSERNLWVKHERAWQRRAAEQEGAGQPDV